MPAAAAKTPPAARAGSRVTTPSSSMLASASTKRRAVAHEDETAPAGAPLLEDDLEQRADELLDLHLAGDGLGRLHHREQVELLRARAAKVAVGAGCAPLDELRVESLELLHLAVCSPAHIAGPRLAEVELGELLVSSRAVEFRRQLVGEGLVLDEAVIARRADGLLVEALGVELPAFDACDLSADEGGAVLRSSPGNCRPTPAAGDGGLSAPGAGPLRGG